MFDYEIRLLKEWIEKDRSPLDKASYLFYGEKSRAKIILKSPPAVLSGVKLIELLLKEYQIETEYLHSDGEEVGSREIAYLKGDTYQLLTLERTALNLLTHLSGIATRVRRLTQKISEEHTVLAATRKTLPGLGYLEKLAVMDGGADAHRWNLADLIMVKDNHIAQSGGIDKLWQKLRTLKSFSQKVEIEVETEAMAFMAAELGADIIMLDNFTPAAARKLAKKIKKAYPHILIEVSGGITEENYLEYVNAEIDVISMSELTNVKDKLDFSLEIMQ
jgi:nicotinate-nucleotide pyrophosphorylase (carboxylating)